MSIQYPHRKRADAANEIRIEPFRRTRDLEAKIALQDFLPEDPDLLFGEAVADATMDAGPERQMLPRLGAIDDEFVGALDLVLVAIARDVPHHHLVTPGDLAAGKLDVVARGAAHMQHGGMVADGLAHQGRDQLAPAPHQIELIRVL